MDVAQALEHVPEGLVSIQKDVSKLKTASVRDRLSGSASRTRTRVGCQSRGCWKLATSWTARSFKRFLKFG
jgi:hypothetical protein